jgi:hypothetical protein
LATVLCWYSKINDFGYMEGTDVEGGYGKCHNLPNDDKIDDVAKARNESCSALY